MLTQKQLWMYRAEWAKARQCLRELGWAASEVEAKRKQIHAAAEAGTAEHPKSSLDLTNRELDRVLAMFRAIYRPGDLGSQLRQLQQPYLRWRFLVDELLDRIAAVLTAAGREHQAVGRGPGREGYLLALAQRLGQRADCANLETISELEQWKVLAALMVRYDQVMAATATAANEGRPASTRPGKPARHRPFDTLPALTQPTPPRRAAPQKPIDLAQLDHDADDSGLPAPPAATVDEPF